MDGEVATKSREVSRYSRYMMMVMTSPGMNFVWLAQTDTHTRDEQVGSNQIQGSVQVLKVHDDGDDFSRYELVLQITCTHKNTHIGDTQRGGNQILKSVQIRKVQDDDDDFSSYNFYRD